MNIWVMRHGEASFNATSDRQRALTEMGIQMAFSQGQWLAKRIKNQELSLDKVLVSPYLRTQQTAEQLLKGMQAVDSMQSFANICENWVGITPSGEVNQVLDYLAYLKTEGVQNILIISHLPLVFDLVQHLTQYQQSVHFYPAVIAEVEWHNPQGKLVVAEYP